MNTLYLLENIYKIYKKIMGIIQNFLNLNNYKVSSDELLRIWELKDVEYINKKETASHLMFCYNNMEKKKIISIQDNLVDDSLYIKILPLGQKLLELSDKIILPEDLLEEMTNILNHDKIKYVRKNKKNN